LKSRKEIIGITIIYFILNVIGCTNSDENSSAKKYVGYWEGLENNILGEPSAYQVSIFENGTVHVNRRRVSGGCGGGYSGLGKWTENTYYDAPSDSMNLTIGIEFLTENTAKFNLQHDQACKRIENGNLNKVHSTPLEADKMSFIYSQNINNSDYIATEIWLSIADDKKGDGIWILKKDADDNIKIDGKWYYDYQEWEIRCPFTNAWLTISETAISFSATGTASANDAPSGYDTSPFTLNVFGTVENEEAYGNYSFTFSTYGWPSTYSGSWTATKLEGNGITFGFGIEPSKSF